MRYDAFSSKMSGEWMNKKQFGIAALVILLAPFAYALCLPTVGKHAWEDILNGFLMEHSATGD